jgi:hypothetical protein
VSLSEVTAAAFERAQTSCDPWDWTVYHALRAALDAEARAAIRAIEPPSDLSGLPKWSEVSKPGTVSWPPT